MQLLRHLGLAARFVSGYLIQLTADVKSLDGPAGPEKDFTDLHAWAEVYLPGAGWIGLDATSGLFAGEGHLPLACTPEPGSASPVTGNVDECKVEFSHEMSITRIWEAPRVTKPYSEEQWQAIDRLGQAVDSELKKNDVRLTMGGEPTFISMDDPEGEEWKTAALGPNKRRLAAEVYHRLRSRYGAHGLVHFGQGKWYPGEPLPRWSLNCFWRADGEPIWRDPSLIADEAQPGKVTATTAEDFLRAVAQRLGLDQQHIFPAYEDLFYYLWREHRLPANVDPFDSRLEDALERRTAHACADSRAKTSRRSRSAGGARLCDRTVAQRRLVFALGALLSVARRFADGLSPAARLAAVDERQRLPGYFSAGSNPAVPAPCHSCANPFSAQRSEVRGWRKA